MKTTSLRAGTLACALLATTAYCVLAARPAAAQAAHTYRQLDANGVDLTHGDLVAAFVEGSIGSGEAELPLVRNAVWHGGAFNSNGHQWDNIRFSQTPFGGGTRYTVAIGPRSETFDGTGTLFSGSTLSGGGGAFTYRTADGSEILFGDPTGSANDESGFCNGSGQSQCSLLPLTMTSPDGRNVTLEWDVWVHIRPDNDQDGEPDNAYFARIARVSNSFGYSLGFAYELGGTGGTSPPATGWHRRGSASFYNDTISTTVAQAGTGYSYPSAGVTQVTDTGGLVWRFAGDQNGISAVRRPGAPADTTAITGTPAAVASVTRDGVTTHYSRSVSGSTATMTVTEVVPGGSSPVTTIVSDLNIGRPTLITDPLGRTTAFQHDGSGRLTRVTAPEGNHVAYTYDARGNVTRIEAVPKGGSGATIVSSASYDETCSNPVRCNRPNSVTDARGNATAYTYDDIHGGVLTETGPAIGGVPPQTRYTYTLAHGEYRVTAISQCRTTSACADGADEVRSTIAYDSQGNVISTSTGSGDGALTATSAMTYDAIGNLLTVDGPLAGTADTSRLRYDAGRRLVGRVSPDPDGAGALKPRAVRNSYTNGLPTKVEQGNVDSHSDADWIAFSSLHEVQTDYDGNARPVKEKLVAGGTTYALTQTGYDALGRPKCAAQRMDSADFGSTLPDACTLTSPAGADGPDRIVQTLYDAAGQIIQVKTALGSADAADEVTATYTANGLVATVKDGENHLTSYEYDGHDRLAKTFYPDASTANTSSTTDYEQPAYESLAGGTRTSGLAVSFRNRAGETIAYGHDALGRLISKDMPGTELDVGYTYDLLGQMLSASQPGTTLTFAWDALGRNLGQAGASGNYSSQYDLAGRRTRLTHPDGFFVDQDYLVTGEMTKIRENGATSGVGVLATFDYDQLGRRERLTLGNGAVTEYQYDPASRLWKLEHDLGGVDTANDNLITLTYNPASQIAGRTATNDLYAWTGHGNGSTVSTFDGLNRLVGYSHDMRGNRTSDGIRTYSYDSENKGRGVAAAPYHYDSLGRLSGAGAPLALAYESYVDRLVAERTPGSSSVARRHVFGPGTDEPLVWYEGAGTADRRFLHADERGSIVAVTDGSGALRNVNRYDEYGRTETSNNFYLSRFGYTGQRYFGGHGLYHYKNRMYDPKVGRFMQPDPIGYGSGMNLYAYVGGDPVNFIDPFGLAPGDCDNGFCEPFDVMASSGPGRGGSPAGGGASGRLMLRMPSEGGGGGGGGWSTPEKPRRPVCPVTKQDSINTGLFGGSLAFVGAHGVHTAIHVARGASLAGLLVSGSAAAVGMTAVVGFIAVGVAVYAYDRYSGGKVTRFIRKFQPGCR